MDVAGCCSFTALFYANSDGQAKRAILLPGIGNTEYEIPYPSLMVALGSAKVGGVYIF